MKPKLAKPAPAVEEDTRPVIAVAIPTHEMCPSTFAFDFAKLMAFSTLILGDKVRFVIHYVSGTYIHKARQQLIEEAQRDGADYLLWLDSDMRFPKDALIQLLNREKDLIGINYSTRNVPPRFVAIKQRTKFADGGVLVPGEVCPTWEDSAGVEEVDAIGFGLVLMRMSIIDKMPRDKPFFFYEWSPETGQLHVGEDVWFCAMAKDAGHQIFIDHDLSHQCAHTGSLEYKLEHAQDFTKHQQEEDDGADQL